MGTSLMSAKRIAWVSFILIVLSIIAYFAVQVISIIEIGVSSQDAMIFWSSVIGAMSCGQSGHSSSGSTSRRLHWKEQRHHWQRCDPMQAESDTTCGTVPMYRCA